MHHVTQNRKEWPKVCLGAAWEKPLCCCISVCVSLYSLVLKIIALHTHDGIFLSFMVKIPEHPTRSRGLSVTASASRLCDDVSKKDLAKTMKENAFLAPVE